MLLESAFQYLFCGKFYSYWLLFLLVMQENKSGYFFNTMYMYIGLLVLFEHSKYSGTSRRIESVIFDCQEVSIFRGYQTI